MGHYSYHLLSGRPCPGISGAISLTKNGTIQFTTQPVNTSSPFVGALYTTPSGIIRYYNPQPNGLTSIAYAGKTWNYNFISVSGNISQVNRSNPDGTIDKFSFGTQGILTETNGLNLSTNYQYIGEQNLGGRANLWKVITPEGNYVKYSYDTNGNLTEIRNVAKSSSGLADSVVTYHYLTGCANTKTCHKPDYVIDARGNQTDYTYSPDHGGVLTETGPADANGVRPQKRYTYTQLYPKVLNSSLALVNSTPVWRLTNISTCRTATSSNPASCVGTDQEVVVEYEYNTNNLLLTKVTTRAGNANPAVAYSSSSNVWQAVSYGYDDVGNQLWVDGPLPGADDRSYMTYDVLRRKVFEIAPDPDGSGALTRKIVKHNYDVDGREYLTQVGTGTATDGSDFVVTSFTRNTYDPTTGLLAKTEVGQP